jgi:hypothetical protein
MAISMNKRWERLLSHALGKTFSVSIHGNVEIRMEREAKREKGKRGEKEREREIVIIVSTTNLKRSMSTLGQPRDQV